MGRTVQDVRHALRSLRRRPLHSCILAGTLALGIGANTAMFSVVDSVLLEPLPYPDADRLVWVWGRTLEGSNNTISAESYQDYRQATTSFEHLAAYYTFPEEYVVTGDEEPEVLVGTQVSWNFFEALRLSPVLGRSFVADDESDASPAVVVLSHALWQRRYGGDPGVVGRVLRLDGTAYEVIGVMPPQAALPGRARLWRPLRMSEPQATGRGNNNYNVLGRLRDGVTIERADAELKALAQGIAGRFPDLFQGWSVALVPLRDVFVSGVRGTLWLLMGGVLLVLLVACANLAALVLARAVAREGEFAIRLALGSSRARLGRQLLTETVVIALIGGVIGLGLAWSLLRALQTLGAGSLPRLAEIGLDGSALAFTIVVSVLTGILFGLAPALRGPRFALGQFLREGRGARLGGGGHRFQGALVVGQVALSLVLLLGAGLLLRSFQQLRQVELGFEPAGLLVAEVRLPAESYGEARPALIFWDAALERIRAIPGVVQASAVVGLPVRSGRGPYNFVWAEGNEPATPADRQGATRRLAAPGYFETMGISLVRGREFTNEDRAGSPLVTIISRLSAETFFPDQDPLGQRLVLWGTLWTVVGVVDDVRQGGLAQDLFPTFYLAMHQLPDVTGATLVVRGTGDPATLLPAVRSAIRGVEPDAPIENVTTMDAQVAAALATDRFRTLLLGSFGAFALVLAGLGLYGVLAYWVGERTHELGVRLALGANRATLLVSVLRSAALLAGTGIVIGLAGGGAISSVMQGMLFGVEPLDPVIFVAVPLVLAGVAAVAALLPAWRAVHVDPVDSLRAG